MNDEEDIEVTELGDDDAEGATGGDMAMQGGGGHVSYSRDNHPQAGGYQHADSREGQDSKPITE